MFELEAPWYALLPVLKFSTLFYFRFPPAPPERPLTLASPQCERCRSTPPPPLPPHHQHTHRGVCVRDLYFVLIKRDLCVLCCSRICTVCAQAVLRDRDLQSALDRYMLLRLVCSWLVYIPMYIHIICPHVIWSSPPTASPLLHSYCIPT